MIYRVLTLALTFALLLPTSASAQFVPKGEVASLGSVAEQEDLQTVLDALAKKNDTARKKVLVTLGQLEEKKIGATNARRQIDSVTGSLKVELNKILADYARQTPPTASVREAYRVAQTYLNDIRAMTEDAATEAAIEKKLDPEAPTGKYLDYQKKIQALATKALEKADERLKERGKKDTVRRDLEQIVKDTERQIELATTSYLLEHTELLESALRRINTKVLEGLASDMEARFKAANERSSDKENDLNDEENETFQTVKQEMTDIVDRTTTTIDSLIRQVLQANLPTTSQEPGVNPLLEAKFKTQKQMADILQTAQDRIGKITARASQNPEYSALLKEVITREATRQKQRLQDTYNEYEGNFIAGDPTKQQYNKRKDRAQDEAKGCDSFLCDIGRVVSGVGSAFISGSTGGLVNIPPQTFSKGLFGIKDPSYAASPYSSSYFNGTPSLPYVNGAYTTPGALGGSSIYFAPQCNAYGIYGNKFVFIEKARAAKTTTGFEYEESKSTTPKNEHKGFFGELFSGNLGGAFGGTGKVFNNIGNAIGDIGQTVRNGYCGTNQYNSGLSSYYGGIPVLQAMGLTSSAQLNLSQDYAPVVSQLFQALGQRDPRLAQFASVFADGQLTGNEFNSVLNPGLQQIGFFTGQTNHPFWQDPIRKLVLGGCYQAFQQQNTLALQICKQQFNVGSSSAGALGGLDANKLGISSAEYQIVQGNMQRITSLMSGVKSNSIDCLYPSLKSNVESLTRIADQHGVSVIKTQVKEFLRSTGYSSLCGS